MTIAELIKALNEALEMHGDIPVVSTGLDGAGWQDVQMAEVRSVVPSDHQMVCDYADEDCASLRSSGPAFKAFAID